MRAGPGIRTQPCKVFSSSIHCYPSCFRSRLQLHHVLDFQIHLCAIQATSQRQASQHMRPAEDSQETTSHSQSEQQQVERNVHVRMQLLAQQVKQKLGLGQRQRQAMALLALFPLPPSHEAHAWGFARLSVLRHPLNSLLRCLKWIAGFLSQPPGGSSPVEAIPWLPGWRQGLIRGPRRWLGLRPGRVQPVIEPGPWYTPSGLLHVLRGLPRGVWLALALFAAIRLVQYAKTRRQRRDKFIQQRTLIAAAKTSDLRVQKDRMLRAVGAEQEDEGEVIVVEAADVQWQDPSEWDPATKQQWDDFMRKSRALQLNKDKWWDVETVDDVPYFKRAHDKLKETGQLPDYELE